MGDIAKRKAMFWSRGAKGAVNCSLCPQACRIQENSAGFCGIRQNIAGELYASGYGLVSSLALDPIEKKPLYMFRSGKQILSIGGFGCNLRCPFCQNCQISIEFRGCGHERSARIFEPDFSSLQGSDDAACPKTRKEELTQKGGKSAEKVRANLMSTPSSNTWQNAQYFLPEQVVEMAEKTAANGNIGLAYTYNEPLINYEFLYDCARLMRKAGMCNVIVSNGFINPEPLEELLPHIDAMNIDLKGFSDEFYKKLGAKGADSTNAVKQAIALAHKHCHVEITTLVIPEENEDEIVPLCEWIASIDNRIPLHLNRFFPRFMYSDKTPTPLQTLHRLSEIAKKYLENVFVGNV